MAYETSNRQLNDLLNFIQETWGITIPEDRVNGWIADLSGSGSNNRTIEQLRQDILKHVVGEENITTWVRTQFGDAAIGTSKESEADRLARIVSELMSGKRGFHDTAKAIKEATGQFPATGAGTGGAGGKEGLPLHILGSSTMRWLKDKATGKFYVEYTLPGGGGRVLFEAEAEQVAALFPNSQPPNFQVFNFTQELGKEGVFFGGNVAEVEGEGTWEIEVKHTIALALDQQNLPDWIKADQKALDLLWVAVTEERTDEWFYSELAKLSSFKDRYPGVDVLMGRGQTVIEAVRSFTEYETALKTLHAAAGFVPDAITPALVGQLLTRGYSMDVVQESYSVWKRLNDFAPALEAFNQVLQAQGKPPLVGTDLYKFLTGTAPAEIYDIYEASSIREAAAASGLGDIFSADDALSLAFETTRNLTVDEAYQQFSQVAAQALRFRHELDVSRFGIEVDDLIDLSFGRAPRSGKTAADVGEALARIAQSAEAQIGSRAAPFVGFTPQGRPQAQSLGGLRQQQ